MLVTRPAGAAASIVQLIKKHGGEAIVFPVIDIAGPGDDSALLASLKRLREVDLVIFVSVHAVHGVTALLRRHRLQIPGRTRVAAVGPKTGAQCERAGIKVDFVPRDRINSEGLLEQLSDFEVAGKNILIFRGQSGRELLRQSLQARGASVRYVESYQRKTADLPVEPLLARWRGNEIDLVVVTSVAVMDALRRLIGPGNHALLEQTPIFTSSRRVAEYCRETGVRAETPVAKKPTDESLVDAIIEWVAA